MGRWPGHVGRLDGCGLSGERRGRRRAERGRCRGRARWGAVAEGGAACSSAGAGRNRGGQGAWGWLRGVLGLVAAHWGRQRVIGVGKLPAPMRGFLPQWDRWAREGAGFGPLVRTAGFGPLGAAALAS